MANLATVIAIFNQKYKHTPDARYKYEFIPATAEKSAHFEMIHQAAGYFEMPKV